MAFLPIPSNARDVGECIYCGFVGDSLGKEHAVDIHARFNDKQQAFLAFVLSHYVSVGVEELDQEKLTPLLRLKYHDSIADAIADLGRAEEISKVFAEFQKYLYQPQMAAR